MTTVPKHLQSLINSEINNKSENDGKMTENDAILHLINHLEANGWTVGDNYCLGNKHGYDIKAYNGKKYLIVEVKGALADMKAYNRKREKFDSGQIKTHLGKAIVKILESKIEMPGCIYAIAHPDDVDIRRTIGKIIPYLKCLNIKHYWISKEKVWEE